MNPVELFLFHLIQSGCPFRRITGIYCPGCGGTRAVWFLLHGHVQRSVFYHPVPVFLIGLFLIFCFLPRGEKGKKIRRRFFIAAAYSLAVITLINFIIKNSVLIFFGVALMG